MEATVIPKDQTKWPHHSAQVEHRNDKAALYGNYGIYPNDISEYGDLTEIIQGFLLYTRDKIHFLEDGFEAIPSLRATWSGGGCNGATLDLGFRVEKFSGKGEPYKKTLKFDVINSRKEPFLVKLSERSLPLCGKCREDDFKMITRDPGPCHHDIAMNFWFDNLLLPYTEKRKKLGELEHTYEMAERKYRSAKDIQNKDRPWYVSYTISTDVMDVYNSLKKRRAGSLETINTICEVMQTEYLDKIRRKLNIPDEVKLTTRKLELADFL